MRRTSQESAPATGSAPGSGPSGVAAAQALGMMDEVTPPQKKKVHPRTKTECRRVVAAELLESGMTASQVSRQLDCTPKFLRTVKRLMEEKGKDVKKGKWSESRSLAVKGGPGRPRTPGLCSF